MTTMRTNIRTFCFLALLGSATMSCNTENTSNGSGTTTETSGAGVGKKGTDPNLVIHNLGDPDKLNPLTSSSADASYIQQQIYSALLEYNPATLELVPQTAVARAEIKEITEGAFAGGMSLTFEIRPEATWDNGTPITAADVAFTIKAVKNPKVNAASQRPYLEFIDKFEIDAANPKKFTIFSKERYFLAESSIGGLSILPEYVYDPEKIMRKFTVEQLDNPASQDALSVNPDVKRFADFFNDGKFEREPDGIIGSGAYKFKEWKLQEYIILERKENWWGNNVKDAPLMKAYPPKIVYKIIPDQVPAIAQMTNEEVDAMVGIKPEKFVELKADKDFNQVFELSTPDQFSYLYLGFNSKDPKFSDKRVRRAFAHLVDVEDIITSLYQGLAIPTNGPINPKKPYYANNLPLIEFSVSKAKALLDEAGWKDSNGNGIIDKTINGKLIEMKVVYKFNQGNPIRKNIGLLLQEEAKRVGIEIEVVSREWTVYLEDTKRRDFDIMSLAWVQGPGLDDMKQIWHTSSDSPDGSNRVGFGSETSDKLIDEIRITLDETRRNELYIQLQNIIYDEQPYVFLCVPSERIAIHRRFNAEGRKTTSLRPGYTPHLFKVDGAK
jgi:peptide/nickel transport system substrate-binding protein